MQFYAKNWPAGVQLRRQGTEGEGAPKCETEQRLVARSGSNDYHAGGICRRQSRGIFETYRQPPCGKYFIHDPRGEFLPELLFKSEHQPNRQKGIATHFKKIVIRSQVLVSQNIPHDREDPVSG